MIPVILSTYWETFPKLVQVLIFYQVQKILKIEEKDRAKKESDKVQRKFIKARRKKEEEQARKSITKWLGVIPTQPKKKENKKEENNKKKKETQDVKKIKATFEDK